jgi:hypothetical protein
MPRALAPPLYDRLREAYPADRAYRADDWNDGPMPDAVRHFLAQVLAHRARVERHRLRQARSEWVAYDHADVERAVHDLERAMQAHAQIPADAWEGVLQQAANAVTAYLVRPVPTLVSFIFDDEDATLPIERVQWRMQFFGPYAYLHEALDTYAERRSLSRLHPNTFRSFLARIDARAVPETDDGDRWMRLLAPLFATARVATGTEAVPTPLLRAFFTEKRATDLAQRLEERDQAGHSATPRTVLRRLMEGRAAPDDAAPDDAAPSGDEPAAETPIDAPADAPASPPETVVEDALLGSPWPPEAFENGPAPGSPEPNDADAPHEAPLDGDPAPDPTLRAEEPPDEPAEPDSSEAPSDIGAMPIEDAPAEESPAEESPAEAPSPANDDVPPAEASPPDDSPTDPPSLGAEPAPTEDETDDEADSPDADAAAPLWRQFQTAGPSRAESSEAAEPDEQTPLWARFKPSQSVSDDGDQESTAEDNASSAGPLDDATRKLEQRIFGHTPAPHREAYVRELFKGSSEDYRRILRRIDRAASWSEASQIVAKDVFRANQINIYSDIAVTFTDAVEASFKE